MSSLDVRVARSSQDVDGEATDVLTITAVNRTGKPVTIWTCILLTTSGLRLYLDPHLDYPLELERGEWCREWVTCELAMRELRERGCRSKTTLVAMFLESLDRRARLISMMLSSGTNMDVRGIEHRAAPFVFDVGG